MTLPDLDSAAYYDRLAREATDRGDGLAAAIHRARAACTRAGRIVPSPRARGWVVEHERRQDVRSDVRGLDRTLEDS
jgi:hypothetical protein